jgi:hypothetical protein
MLIEHESVAAECFAGAPSRSLDRVGDRLGSEFHRAGVGSDQPPDLVRRSRCRHGVAIQVSSSAGINKCIHREAGLAAGRRI